MISIRPHSRKEIEKFLTKKLRTITPETAISVRDTVLSRLEEMKYIDDEAFASWYIKARSGHHARGIEIIKRELQVKGVPLEIIDRVYLSISEQGEFDELENAKRALGRKLERFVSLPKLDAKKKLYRFLTRRGFSREVFERLVDEI